MEWKFILNSYNFLLMFKVPIAWENGFVSPFFKIFEAPKAALSLFKKSCRDFSKHVMWCLLEVNWTKKSSLLCLIAIIIALKHVKTQKNAFWIASYVAFKRKRLRYIAMIFIFTRKIAKVCVKTQKIAFKYNDYLRLNAIYCV